MSRSLRDLDEPTRYRVRVLMGVAELLGMRLFVVHTHRTYAEQDALFSQGRTAPGRIVTKARGGESWHNYRRAVDFAFTDPGEEDPNRPQPTWNDPTPDEINDWTMLGWIGEKLGLFWGGRWESLGDFGHFHYTGGQTREQVRAEYEDRHPDEIA